MGLAKNKAVIVLKNHLAFQHVEKKEIAPEYSKRYHDFAFDRELRKLHKIQKVAVVLCHDLTFDSVDQVFFSIRNYIGSLIRSEVICLGYGCVPKGRNNWPFHINNIDFRPRAYLIP